MKHLSDSAYLTLNRPSLSSWEKTQRTRIDFKGMVRCSDNKWLIYLVSRGRNAGRPAPPAQIPACATNAPGSYLR